MNPKMESLRRNLEALDTIVNVSIERILHYKNTSIGVSCIQTIEEIHRILHGAVEEFGDTVFIEGMCKKYGVKIPPRPPKPLTPAQEKALAQ